MDSRKTGLQGTDHPVSATSLENMARGRFGQLTDGELKLVRAAPRGEQAACGPVDISCVQLADMPKHLEKSGKECEIRAALVRWLCTDNEAKRLVSPDGIRIGGAVISGPLDLYNGSVPFGLSFNSCRLTDNANLMDLEVGTLDLQGCWVLSITGDRARVKGSILLRNGFHADGCIKLVGVEVASDVDCSCATFKNLSDVALGLDRAKVNGSVYLNNGFQSEGAVQLSSARIGGSVTATGGTFKRDVNSGPALTLQGAEVSGDVQLTGVHIDGDVDLPDIKVGHQLDCSNANINRAFGLEAGMIGSTFFWRNITLSKNTILDLINTRVGSLSDDSNSWPPKSKLFLDGFSYSHISDPKDATSRLNWLSRQDFTRQPYRQLASVMREAGDEEGSPRT